MLDASKGSYRHCGLGSTWWPFGWGEMRTAPPDHQLLSGQRSLLHREEVDAVWKCTGGLTPDILSKNTSPDRQAYASALTRRSFRLCFLPHPSEFWSEESNYSRSPASCLICHCLCCFVAFEWDPRYRDLVGAGGLLDPDAAPAPFCCAQEARLSFPSGTQSPGRGCPWRCAALLSLLWLLLPSARAKEPTGL